MSGIPEAEYLGDGIYVAYAHDQLEVSIGDHRNPPVAFLERDVFDKLVSFAAACGWTPKGN